MTSTRAGTLRIYELESDPTAGYTGELGATPRWGLPGLKDCPGCGATWAAAALHYPCVDLSQLPGTKEYEKPRAEPYDELMRLLEKVRPLMPQGAILKPGVLFGPMKGWAKGTFGQLYMQNPWTLCLRREALERLQEAGVRGLQGCPLEVRYRGKNPPELFELQLEFHARFHPDCLPAEPPPPPCSRCGRESNTLPDPYILDAKTLPATADVFRLADWPTYILATERFVETAHRLKLDGVVFREVPVR
ncbi:MAG TPA: double-CXXCG motif protein [Myxococcus sp.]|nr:double-CXXCG motif protein [Myxococcus sp.]